MRNYEVYTSKNRIIKAWTKGVPVEPEAIKQLQNTASLPFIYNHVAVMPDVHYGMGATIGSVVATKGAVIPAAVGVDIGCGMMAIKLSLNGKDLPDSLSMIRSEIERAVPVGFAQHRDNVLSNSQQKIWANDVKALLREHSDIAKMAKDPMQKVMNQSGTLGGGNHFIELCLDENNDVWVMLHSGSRGIGNMIGRYFIQKAKEDMRIHHINLEDSNLSYLSEGTQHFDQYVTWVEWAQKYAAKNRQLMMDLVLVALEKHLPAFTIKKQAINCHHNYISRENHFGSNVIVTRKGAVRARVDDYGIIPGSMGAKSFIVRGLGNEDSFCSCSHGAGRVMSRTKAKKVFAVADHIAATQGVECRKDKYVIDETPKAYKNIEAVMKAQADLVEIVHTLKQVVCVKG
ncbi:MAG: RtcB family protein [Alcanivoracaceae bacterium]|nr:RtcB family protein [Alcanivoracaceae bacterium]